MKHGKKYYLSYLWGSVLVAQIILVCVFGLVNEVRLKVVTYTGWIIWGISVILGWLPIFILKRNGGVAKGKSYVQTSI
jgi:hypothetical protein